MLYRIFGGLVAIVGVVALISSASDAASIAGKGAQTIGITAGAIIAGTDDLIRGFQDARAAAGSTDSPALAPAPGAQRTGARGATP